MSPEAEAANRRRRERLAETCEHYTPPPLGMGRNAQPWTCKAGIDVAAVKRPRPPDAPLLAHLPCFGEGRAVGLTCASCLLPTQEQLDERDADLRRTMDGLSKGVCGECGAKLLRRGTAFACPNGHVSGFACGPKDIREDGR